MIEFKDLPIRETASIMKGQFEQVKMLYQENPALAGELAISMMEQALCLDYSSTDFMVQLILKNYENIVEKKAEKYDAKKFASMEAKKDQLRPIAKMLSEGKTQKEISRILNIPTSTLSDRVKKIRTEFPDLLTNPDPEKNSDSNESESDNMNPEELGGNPVKKAGFDRVKNPENPENPDHVNVNVNVNVNDNALPSNEESLRAFELSELKRLGATYVELGNDIIQFPTGKKGRLVRNE